MRCQHMALLPAASHAQALPICQATGRCRHDPASKRRALSPLPHLRPRVLPGPHAASDFVTSTRQSRAQPPTSGGMGHRRVPLFHSLHPKSVGRLLLGSERHQGPPKGLPV